MNQRHPSNVEVARALREMALFLEMDDVPFKPRAYDKAADAVAALEQPIAHIYADGGERALDALPHVGKGIARRVAELLRTGEIADLEALRAKTPVDVLALTAVEGVGPKTVRALWDALEIRSVDDLERAAKQGRIHALPHFGDKREQNILEAIAFFKADAGRRPLGEVLALARRIAAALAEVPGVEQLAIAGSLRRHRDTIGDVDLLVVAREPVAVSTAFTKLPEVRGVFATGPTKTLVRLTNGIDADLRVVSADSFGAALVYFTGSKAHNVALRRLANDKGLKLNEYGLFRGRRSLAGRTEEEVYAALGMSFVPPEMREDTGEIQLALAGRLPRVVEAEDIRGDLHVHTSWTDGAASIEAMARAARRLGREYVVISDHTRDLALTGGLDEPRLRKQIAAVRKADRSVRGVRVLAGAEVNIRPDGSLDVADDVLAELDVVGAAVHSRLDQPRADMTRRLVRAIEHPRVHVLFHPTNRAIGRRPPVDVDFDELLAACARTGTALELDAQPDRLDLPDPMVRRAVEAGVRVAIDSDAHDTDQLRNIETFGIAAARRGWAKAEDVVNTRSVDEMLAALGRRTRS